MLFSIHVNIIRFELRSIKLFYKFVKMSKKYFRALSGELTRNLNSITTIKKFADNSAILGAYCENVIQVWLQAFFKENISTGGIISPELYKDPKKVAQLDHIIWKPSPLPAIFTVNDFALVPSNSAFGIVEIKSSNYPKAVSAIEKVLLFSKNLKREPKAKLQITNDQGIPLVNNKRARKAKALTIEIQFPVAFGVICILDNPISKKLNQLLENGEVFFLIEKKGNSYKPNSGQIFKLINKVIQLKLAMDKTQGGLSESMIKSFGG